MSLADLLTEVRACTECADHLPHGVRPVMQAGSGAGVIVIGQAPGRRVHESGVPWDDPSGTRLRDWLGVDDETFYDPESVAILPMGFCYPGTGSSGDHPPRPECAPLWHDRVLAHLREDALRVVIGMYAQKRYLPDRSDTLTATVQRWDEYLPDVIPLPHPSPRNQRWLRRNPWFDAEVVPALRARVAEAIG
mgnify:CR=1 FL=1